MTILPSDAVKNFRVSPRLAAGVLVSALLLSACSSSSAGSPTTTATSGGATGSNAGAPAASGATKNLTLTLNFLAAGPNSGFILAQKEGYYSQAGLTVKIQEGQGSGTTASLVASGNSDFGFADAPAAMAVRSKGGAVKIIAPILQTNGFSVMSLAKNNISKAADLKGKSLAVQPGTAQAALLGALLKANGLTEKDINLVNLDPSALVGSLLQGRIDAIAAGGDAQGVQLQEQGATINQITYRDAGVPTVGLSLITSDAEISKDPATVKKFVAASLKGWDDARKNPQAAADATAAMFPQAGQASTFLSQLKIDLPLLCATNAKTLGNAPASNWTTTFNLLNKYESLPTAKPVTDYYTTALLPAGAPAC